MLVIMPMYIKFEHCAVNRIHIKPKLSLMSFRVPMNKCDASSYGFQLNS